MTRKVSSSDEMEKRIAGERLPVKIKMEYSTGEAQMVNYCKDLGRGGVFIVTDGPHGPGTQLNLIFTLDENKVIKTKGKVIWVQEPVPDRPDLTPGMGVQFLDLNDKNYSLLNQFIINESSKNE